MLKSNFFLLKVKSIILLSCLFFFVVSCKDDKLEPEPTVLSSPEAEGIIFTQVGPVLTIEWTAVDGAGGYEFSLYTINDDGENPVGTEREKVTLGTSVERPSQGTTKLRVEIKSLGSPLRNTLDALAPTVKYWPDAFVLSSPASSTITFNHTEDETEVDIAWFPIPGASGYEFSFYKLDLFNDTQEIVGIEKEILTETTVRRPIIPSTFYKVVLKSLGSTHNNTLDATVATERLWNSDEAPEPPLIPSGTNLTEWLWDFPPIGDKEMVYKLEAGGTYFMTDDINIRLTPVTIEGAEKNNPSKLEISKGVIMSDGGSLRLRNLDITFAESFDFIDAEYKSLVCMNPTRNAAALIVPHPENERTYVLAPYIEFISCKITNIQFSLFYDGGNAGNAEDGIAESRYLYDRFLIDDCIIGYNVDNYNSACLRFAVSLPKDITITKSTFYNEQLLLRNPGELQDPPRSPDEIYQIRFVEVLEGVHAAQFEPVLPDWKGGKIEVSNCTFWQFSKGPNPCPTIEHGMANGRGGSWAFNFSPLASPSSPFGQATDRKIATNLVIVDSFEWNWNATTQRPVSNCFMSRYFRGGNGVVRIAANNTYWHHGAFHSANVMDTSNPSSDQNVIDGSGTHIESDPGLTYLGNGNFTMTGAEQRSKGTGDPRWLP